MRALSVGDVMFSVMDPGSEFRIDFVSTTIDGEPLGHEHSAPRWVSLHDLPELDRAPSDRHFVEVVLSRVAKAG